jgi:hypothetical protein
MEAASPSYEAAGADGDSKAFQPSSVGWDGAFLVVVFASMDPSANEVLFAVALPLR